MTAECHNIDIAPHLFTPSFFPFYKVFQIRSVYMVSNLFINPGGVDDAVDSNGDFVFMEMHYLLGRACTMAGPEVIGG